MARLCLVCAILLVLMGTVDADIGSGSARLLRGMYAISSVSCSSGMYWEEIPCVEPECRCLQPDCSTAYNAQCTKCPEGTFNAADDASSCKKCKAGSWAPAGAVACIPCPAGTVDHDDDPSTPCTPKIDLNQQWLCFNPMCGCPPVAQPCINAILEEKAGFRPFVETPLICGRSKTACASPSCQGIVCEHTNRSVPIFPHDAKIATTAPTPTPTNEYLWWMPNILNRSPQPTPSTRPPQQAATRQPVHYNSYPMYTLPPRRYATQEPTPGPNNPSPYYIITHTYTAAPTLPPTRVTANTTPLLCKEASGQNMVRTNKAIALLCLTERRWPWFNISAHPELIRKAQRVWQTSILPTPPPGQNLCAAPQCAHWAAMLPNCTGWSQSSLIHSWIAKYANCSTAGPVVPVPPPTNPCSDPAAENFEAAARGLHQFATCMYPSSAIKIQYHVTLWRDSPLVHRPSLGGVEHAQYLYREVLLSTLGAVLRVNASALRQVSVSGRGAGGLAASQRSFVDNQDQNDNQNRHHSDNTGAGLLSNTVVMVTVPATPAVLGTSTTAALATRLGLLGTVERFQNMRVPTTSGIHAVDNDDATMRPTPATNSEHTRRSFWRHAFAFCVAAACALSFAGGMILLERNKRRRLELQYDEGGPVAQGLKFKDLYQGGGYATNNPLTGRAGRLFASTNRQRAPPPMAPPPPAQPPPPTTPPPPPPAQSTPRAVPQANKRRNSQDASRKSDTTRRADGTIPLSWGSDGSSSASAGGSLNSQLGSMATAESVPGSLIHNAAWRPQHTDTCDVEALDHADVCDVDSLDDVQFNADTYDWNKQADTDLCLGGHAVGAHVRERGRSLGEPRVDVKSGRALVSAPPACRHTEEWEEGSTDSESESYEAKNFEVGDMIAADKHADMHRVRCKQEPQVQQHARIPAGNLRPFEEPSVGVSLLPFDRVSNTSNPSPIQLQDVLYPFPVPQQQQQQHGLPWEIMQRGNVCMPVKAESRAAAAAVPRRVAPKDARAMHGARGMAWAQETAMMPVQVRAAMAVHRAVQQQHQQRLAMQRAAMTRQETMTMPMPVGLPMPRAHMVRGVRTMAGVPMGVQLVPNGMPLSRMPMVRVQMTPTQPPCGRPRSLSVPRNMLSAATMTATNMVTAPNTIARPKQAPKKKASRLQKMCEDCGQRRSNYAVPAEGRMRWCSICAKQGHPDARNMRHKMCEDCGLKAPSFGMPGDRKRRWCVQCARVLHVGSIDVISKKCEDCGLKAPHFGLPREGKKRRWCAACARKAHPDARNVAKWKQGNMGSTWNKGA